MPSPEQTSTALTPRIPASAGRALVSPGRAPTTVRRRFPSRSIALRSSRRSSPSRRDERHADLLATYLTEVRRYPFLTRDEELSLARRARREGDSVARFQLVNSHLRLVVTLAREHQRSPLALMDLIQEGNLGLVQAVERFDPERGVTLSAYAAWWIRAYLLRFIMENWKLVKIGTTDAQRKLFFRLRSEQQRLLAAGFEPSPRLLAERFHVAEQDVTEMDQRLKQDDLRLDAPALPSGDDSPARVHALPSGTPAVDEQLAQRELTRMLRTELARFMQQWEDPRWRFILEHRLLTDTPLSLEAIGQHFGVSRERARQVESDLISELREFLRHRLPDFDWLRSASASAPA
ncbi:RNA polymerase factor sigma-32 [Hyalangium versicolor]|uniref:RNA polymerase factor sigma-32 n=1 Tax=Hyalangium versicolor TaxID=2861190 RepID=UPI001CCBDE44|nr:RNA polymerase factor sigma-32 [Hyalangium versicolor]